MTSQYYATGPERANNVQRLFNRIARRYDLINDLQSAGFHRLWKRRLIHEAQIQPGQRALDVCCGTGDIALRLAGKGAIVTACDFSPEMLARARERFGEALSGAAISLVQADALRLPFEAEAFDVVAISYGLRNLADYQRGLDELCRVLKPGGRVLILDFGKPANRIWRAAYFAYLRAVVPLLGFIFCGDASAYAYILESLKHYPAQPGISRILSGLGCQVHLRNILGGVMSLHVGVKSARKGQPFS